MVQLDHPPRKKQNTLVAVLFVAVVALITTLYVGLGLNPKDVTAQFENKPAFNFKAAWIQGQDLLPNATEENFRLEDFKGKNVILNFWASWCVSCRTEAVDLETFFQETKDQGDLVVVGIAIQDTEEDAKKFAAHYGKQYILGLDTDGNTSIDYGVTGVPETVFIDKNGMMKYKHVGPVDVAMLKDLVTKHF